MQDSINQQAQDAPGTTVALGRTQEPAKAPVDAKTTPDTPRAYNPAMDDKWVRDAVQPWNIDDTIKNSLYPAKQNLYIVADGTAKTVAITADYINVGGIGFKNVSLTLNMGTTGENALDTGAIANSAWYAMWLITSVHGEKLACTAHVCTNKATRDTVPALPAGYTLARRIGMIIAKNDHTTILKSTQLNDWAWWYAAPATDPPGSLFAAPIASGLSGRIYDGTYATIQGYYDPC